MAQINLNDSNDINGINGINSNLNSNSKLNNSSSKPSQPLQYSNINISHILTGCKDQGAKQYQEDSLCTFYSPDLTVLVAAVFDGHGGLNGQVASQIVSNLTEKYFKENWQKCKIWNDQQWTKEMEIFFDELHNSVRKEFIEVIILFIYSFIHSFIIHYNYK